MIAAFKAQLLEILQSSGAKAEQFGISSKSPLVKARPPRFGLQKTKSGHTLCYNGKPILTLNDSRLWELFALLKDATQAPEQKARFNTDYQRFWATIKSAKQAGVPISSLDIKITDNRRVAQVTYRDPKTGKTWNGIGVRPFWFLDYLEAGKDPDKIITKSK
jgi:hypothetical protein